MSLHEPFTEEELAPTLENFYKNGAAIIHNVLSRAECEQICSRVDQIFAEPYFTDSNNLNQDNTNQTRGDHQ